ncbi:hypothetical protein [Paenibacillus silvisoli]|uniref:hypothetical protein n=1 Tax=Paenibacillus silvisoli TaxID=3110539 RepID=UPI0028046DBC|nr:hypothetical protein [Paenibacillus silvisoli]
MKALKKSAALVSLALLLTILLAGCQENRPASPEAPADSSANHSPDNSADSEVIKEGTIPKDGNVILKELSFVHQDITIALSDIVDDAKLESMLGKAEEKESHTYSADDGLNMDHWLGRTKNLFKFPGLEIETFDTGKGSDFRITRIEITDSKYPTIRNIKVGDSVEELKQAYPEGNLMGNGATGEEDDYRYTPVNYVDVMTFHIRNEKIESIRISTLLD